MNYDESRKIRNSSQKGGKKRKHEEVSQNENSNKKKNKSYFFCGKRGHFKKECRFYKKLKIERNSKKANIIQSQPSPGEIVAMVNKLNVSTSLSATWQLRKLLVGAMILALLYMSATITIFSRVMK